MDRSIGTLRKALRDLQIADNTLLVFCSDNGGLPGIEPGTVGGLRGNKGSVYEGGLRVPGIIEWPAHVQPRITKYPACTMDLFPTVADILDLPADVFIQPVDGLSLKPLLTEELATRAKPIPFRFHAQAALVDNQFKMVTANLSGGKFELYDLQADAKESHDLGGDQPERFNQLKEKLLAFNSSVEASFAGQDYPEGRVSPPDPASVPWTETPSYQPYLSSWKDRWEYKSAIDSRGKVKKGGKNKK
jgi:arylsulfatase A-like enzyme